jgi:hypothetical protein
MKKKPIETLSLEQLATVQGGRYGVNRPPRNSNRPK